MYLNLIIILRLFYFFRWQAINILLKKIFSSDTFSFPLNGNKLFVRKKSSDFFVFSSIFLFHEFRFPNSFKSPSTILDLGANNGASAIFFANKFPSAKIIAVEPDNDNFFVLDKNTKNYENIIIVHGAIGSHSGYAQIKDSQSQDWAKQFQRSDQGIPIFTIMDLKRKFGLNSIDLLKVDIEGAEAELFNSEYEWLSQTKNIIIELHDSLVDGCSQNFYRAISHRNFTQSLMGEKVFIRLLD